MRKNQHINRLFLCFFLAAFLIGGKAVFTQEAQEKKVKIIIPDEPPNLLMPGIMQRISVSGSMDWTDSGYDVLGGQKIFFKAAGAVSLQQGNPVAYCGPDGKTMNTIQQPLRDKPIGALIGRIVNLISIEVDEETGEEKRNEVIELFYIGESGTVIMPIDGRLFLGVNETVVEDNDGSFSVTFYSQ